MKKWLAIVLAAMMVFSLVTCASAEGKTLKVGISWAHYNVALFYAWGVVIEEIFTTTAADHGYTGSEIVSLVAEDDAQKQASDISDLLTQGCDLIIAYAFDNQAIASSIAESHAAGVPIVLWDRDVAADATEAPDLFVGLDTYNQAYLAGKDFFQMLADKGVEATEIISIIGATNDNNALNRQKGFEDAAAEFGLSIAQTVPSDWDAEKALTGFTAAYQAHPDCNCVLIASDFIITSVQTVLEANDAWIPAGEEGHIWVCSQDGFPSGTSMMLEGYMDYSGMYNIDAMCSDLADAVYPILEGTYTGEAKLYSDPLIVSAEEIGGMTDLWGIAYANAQ